MSEHAVNGFIGISMEKIRSIVDADTMIGNPISCADGTTVIPVSKISVGFVSGGSDLPTRTSKEYFAGGAGAGMSVKPAGFLVVKNGEAHMIPLSDEGGNSIASVIDRLPELIDKINSMLSKEKKEKTVKKSKVIRTEKTESDS